MPTPTNIRVTVTPSPATTIPAPSAPVTERRETASPPLSTRPLSTPAALASISTLGVPPCSRWPTMESPTPTVALAVRRVAGGRDQGLRRAGRRGEAEREQHGGQRASG